VLVDDTHVRVVGVELSPTGGEVVDVWRRPVAAGSVRNGLVADRDDVSACLRGLGLPDVPAVVAVDAVAVDGTDTPVVVTHGWVPSGVRTWRVPVDALVRLREAVAAAGLRTVGWAPAALVGAGDVADRLDNVPDGFDPLDGVAAAAALWPSPSTWPVGLPAPPPGGWQVDHVG
jgi:hypothetical protein